MAARKTTPPKRIGVTLYQRDILLGAVKREITAVRNVRDTPDSIKLLALEQLNSMESALESLYTTTA